MGFDWEKKEDVWGKVQEEISEVENEMRSGNKADFEKEFGINIPDNECDAAAGWTVSELCDYVEERLKERKK